MKWLFWIPMVALAQVPVCGPKEVLAPVVVSVVDKPSGVEIEGLTAADFMVSGKGVQPGVLEMREAGGMDIVLLIEERSRPGVLTAAADFFLQGLRPQDQVSVYTYGVGTLRRVSWTRDKGSIATALRMGEGGFNLQRSRGLSAVSDVTKGFADDIAEGRDFRRRVILMMGDDQDQSSMFRVEQLVPALNAKRVTLDLAVDPPPARLIPRVSVPLPTPGGMDPTRPQMQTPMGAQSIVRLAALSGGGSLQPVKSSFLRDMLERARNRYHLNYCVDRKYLDRMPEVRLSPKGQAEFPGVEVRGPGATSK
jgi:hypothetical protein